MSNDYIATVMFAARNAIARIEIREHEIKRCRQIQIESQSELNGHANDLARHLGIEPGRNRVILYKSDVYNLEVTANGASLTRIESVTI